MILENSQIPETSLANAYAEHSAVLSHGDRVDLGGGRQIHLHTQAQEKLLSRRLFREKIRIHHRFARRPTGRISKRNIHTGFPRTRKPRAILALDKKKSPLVGPTIGNEISMPNRQSNLSFNPPSAIDKEVYMLDLPPDPLFAAVPAVDMMIEMVTYEPQSSSSVLSSPKGFLSPPLLSASSNDQISDDQEAKAGVEEPKNPANRESNPIGSLPSPITGYQAVKYSVLKDGLPFCQFSIDTDIENNFSSQQSQKYTIGALIAEALSKYCYLQPTGARPQPHNCFYIHLNCSVSDHQSYLGQQSECAF